MNLNEIAKESAATDLEREMTRLFLGMCRMYVEGVPGTEGKKP